MKRILITGENSYVGKNFMNWMSQWPNEYEIETISLKSNDWKTKDFSVYNSILHLAAIVHQKEKAITKAQYAFVNSDLAVLVAMKAKSEGVRQFTFMSSMAVYGVESELGKEVIIRKDSQCSPTTFYGQSKLDAEKRLKELTSDNFKLTVLRPPMIYGKGCPGNYAKLEKLSLLLPVFPLIDNKRSMLYIDNLSEFLKNIIDQETEGIHIPQDKDYICTSDLVVSLAKNNGKNIALSKILGQAVVFLFRKNATVRKMFGSLCYEKE